MTWKELKEISRPHYYCLLLDKYFPKIFRNILRNLSAFLAVAALVSFTIPFDSLPLYFGVSDGVFFICIFVYLSLSFLEFFYRSMKGEGLRTTINDRLLKKDKSIDYVLSGILFATDEIDVTRAFFETKVGKEILTRSGILLHDFKNFIYSERSPIIASSLDFEGDFVNLADYVCVVYDADKALQSFLSHNSINREEFVGSATWVMDMEEKKRCEERFWGKENLGAIPSIGTSWSYGTSFDLGKFGIPFERTVNLSVFDMSDGYREEEVSLLESIIERREKANAIIIDDDEEAVRDIVGRFLKNIKLGITQPYIERKTIIELDWPALLASYKNKSDFEFEILKILNQSTMAGNVILYINDLSGFISSTKSSGINLPSLLSPYLLSAELPVIASATNSDFHFFIETVPTLLEKFERIIPTKPGIPASVCALLEQVPSFEKQYGLLFSYPSVLSLAKSADRYVTYGEMPGKALSLLNEIAPWAVESGLVVLKESDVSIFIARKTGINIGTMKKDEAEKIEHFEKLLHKRVVGQEEAVKGIADAVRRSRSGINNPNRPISSFLFIGPTGVGKTEVSKALAESFFGNENKMICFDMSEYNGPDAISRMIGDFTFGKSGLLASKVRDNPYSVLLLDEFEKAAPDVLDLFLQILDEGIFTDALGKQVNCRDLIIIATSNAGSDLIWQSIKSGIDLMKSKDSIIDAIIKDKVFKPELLNRFDGIILFHPLHKNELSIIARFGLQKLARRLKEQNFELVINEALIDFLVEKGSDPQFGGRSINRAIQDQVENLIANKIVSGVAKPGSKIEIKKEELM